MHFPENSPGRRRFLNRMMGVAGVTAAMPALGVAQGRASGDTHFLPPYARAMTYKSLKQSSYDRSGGNADYFKIPAGGAQEVFASEGPGVISHIWFTIAAQSSNHLKEVVLRIYWDGNRKPSVEAPVGDFFGLNLGTYVIYESAFLACSPGKSLNCYFAMPFRKSARITVTNESKHPIGAFYSNIDYQTMPELPDDTVYFHAQYHQATPNKGVSDDWKDNGDANKLKNSDGKNNYVYVETRGRGHLMGVTLGVLQNQKYWMGEGDEMIFVDDEAKPVIIGTGSEDYFLGSWDFGGPDAPQPFFHRFYGAPYIQSAELTGGRYLCYRWHGDNPVTFTRYLKHTMEHGHGNSRSDNFYSVGYWYQTEPYTDFPALAPADQRVVEMKGVRGPGGTAG